MDRNTFKYILDLLTFDMLFTTRVNPSRRGPGRGTRGEASQYMHIYIYIHLYTCIYMYIFFMFMYVCLGIHIYI